VLLAQLPKMVEPARTIRPEAAKVAA